jgi:ABC-2 type transport system permease protein
LLLRPVHPVHADIAQNISYKLLTSAVMLPVAAVLTLVFRPAFHASAWEVIAFIPALALAFCVRFAIEWTLALMAFWVTRVSAVNEVYYVAMLFLSGQMAPLSLFPEPIRVVASLLPFRWIASFPVELILGRLSSSEIAIGLAAQLVWLAISVALVSFIWRAGVRRYSAVGA